MLGTVETLIQGQVYSIKGESKSYQSWFIITSENKRINLRKNLMGSKFKFVDQADCERLNKIQMLTSTVENLTEGKMYIIVGQSINKISWRILNDKNDFSMVKKNMEGQDFKFCSVLPPTIGSTSVDLKEEDSPPKRIAQGTEMKGTD